MAKKRKGIHEDALSMEYERLEALALKFVLWGEFQDEVECFITKLLGPKPNMPTPEQVLACCREALTAVMLRVSLSGLFRKVK